MKKQIMVTTTWDDSHILDFKLAKLLKKYGIKGTFYISPKNREFREEELLSDEYDWDKIVSEIEEVYLK
jgi:peptidoglycan/xylan/chitin deacetylase (PgdA/CDA1 family)